MMGPHFLTPHRPKPAWRRRLSAIEAPVRDMAHILALPGLIGLVLCLSLARPAWPRPASVDEVAALTLVPLPDGDMSQIKGGALHGPDIGGGLTPAGSVILWDEMKPAPAANSGAMDGASTLTVNGAVQ